MTITTSIVTAHFGSYGFNETFKIDGIKIVATHKFVDDHIKTNYYAVINKKIAKYKTISAVTAAIAAGSQ